MNIDGKVDYTTTDNTVLNTDGSSTETVTKTSANGTVIGSTITTTSGNGLSVTTETEENGNGVVNQPQTTTRCINANGSKTETIAEASANGTVYAQQVIVQQRRWRDGIGERLRQLRLRPGADPERDDHAQFSPAPRWTQSPITPPMARKPARR